VNTYFEQAAIVVGGIIGTGRPAVACAAMTERP